MKRFVDIRGQDTGLRFCFFDTGIMKIESYSGNNAWDTFEELESDIMSDRPTYQALELVERYRGLTPEWAFKEPEYKEFPKDTIKLFEALTNESVESFISRILTLVETTDRSTSDVTIYFSTSSPSLHLKVDL